MKYPKNKKAKTKYVKHSGTTLSDFEEKES